jgi:CDP-4-dehydro-6-deoxyglucose reductase, E3
VRNATSPQPINKTLITTSPLIALPQTVMQSEASMPYQITIKPSELSFLCADDETVLAAAMRADLMIPYGCRNGACGTCKSRIAEGEIDYGRYQAGTLTDSEIKQGLALLCVATPKTDVTVEVREVRRAGDIRIRKLPCRVEKIEKVAKDVAIVSLKLPANERLQYLAGQYIDFLLKDGRRRSFSLATPPENDALLELHVRHVPGGFFSDQLFTQFKGREILRLEGPLGTFFLREESDKPIIFVAGGTGFAPIKAVIEHTLHKQETRPMVLYWGVRSLADLYLPQLPAEWQKQHRGFSFIPVLSDPLPEDAWPGRTGFVHKAVMADFADLSGYQVYACGGPAMIDAARAEFTRERKLAPEDFYADSFTYAAQSEAPA